MGPAGPTADPVDVHGGVHGGTSDASVEAYGGPSGIFGVRASGQGEFTADTDFSFTDTITNNFGVPASYNLNFTVDAGQVSLGNLDRVLAGQSADAEFLLDIIVNGSRVFDLSIEAEKLGLAPIVLTESADAAGLGATTVTDGTTFLLRSWSAHNFNVNLGTFGSGASFNLSYQMSASAMGPGCFDDGGPHESILTVFCVGAGARSGDPLTIKNGGTGVTGTPINTAVPEPASLTMMGLGFVGLVVKMRRGRRT